MLGDWVLTRVVLKSFSLVCLFFYRLFSCLIFERYVRRLGSDQSCFEEFFTCLFVFLPVIFLSDFWEVC